MKKVVIIFGAIFTVPIIAYGVLTARSFLRGTDLSASNDVRTEYIFRFGEDRQVHINDTFSRISRAWDGSPSHIETKNGLRTIVFVEPAILKTNTDSIEPQASYVKLKGHMGVISEDTEFLVDSKGIISSTAWLGG